MKTVEGRVWLFGDHVDTDVIIPARFLTVTDGETLARHCFLDIRPEFPGQVRKGDVLIAGANFGCGSSREHAPIALKATGIRAIVAKGFARLFYRNAFNIGLPLLESNEAADLFFDGECVVVDPAAGEVRDVTGGRVCRTKGIPPFMREIVEAGGLVNHVKAKAKSQGA
jgi:3-isopropylmalate/(R)-2-methylmalate dehydratase small subunit